MTTRKRPCEEDWEKYEEEGRKKKKENYGGSGPLS
jgi:hypothetical protein